MRHSITCLLASSLLLSTAACLDLEDEAELEIGSTQAEVVTEQGIRLQGVRLQGVRLQGVRLQGVRLQGVRLQGVRLQGVTLKGSNITGVKKSCSYTYNRYYRRWVYSCTDTTVSGSQLIGSTLEGQADDGSIVQMRIVDAQTDPGNSDIWLYDIQMQNPDNGYWYDICPADGQGRTSAIAMNGYWDDTGAHHASTDVFSLGCTVGVIYKCASWGYKPWQSRYVYQWGRWYPVSLAGHHQACTRMARADYCGTGVSHTINGNAIDIEDDLAINVEDPTWTATLEAGWNENGAVCAVQARNAALKADSCTYAETTSTSVSWELDKPDCDASSHAEIFLNYPAAKMASESNSWFMDLGPTLDRSSFSF